ncbi:hypothetical protein Leryth_012710 [Lithospermum erythrorhizon]|nr:hypothetical protein Leryth_012710 [Lithospermum erythrorhizon]
MPSFSFFPFFFILLLPYTSLSYPYNYSVHIDCGASTNSSDVFGTQWLSDRFFSGGATSIVSEPLRFRHQHEKSLRLFPVSGGKKNCYSIPLPTTSAAAGKFDSGGVGDGGESGVAGGGGGRYLLRTFTVYDNYNGKSHSPSFDVAVDGVVVFAWRSPWPEAISRSGAYSDLIVSVPDGEILKEDTSHVEYVEAQEIDVCFYSIATDSPVVSSIELFEISPDAYLNINETVSNNSILVNYGRFSAGLDQWGQGFSNDTDRFGRSWQSESDYRSKNDVSSAGSTVQSISALKKLVNVDRPPNYFPPKLYEAGVTVVGDESFGYELEVDAKLDYFLWFHFAEIDVGVTKAGQRVFDVIVNGENVSRVDVFKKVGGFAAYDFSYVVKNLSTTLLTVKLSPVVGSPIICGLENYAIVPADLRTVPGQGILQFVSLVKLIN